MNIEDIKVGKTYNVRMKVIHKDKDQVCVKNPMISVYGCDYMIISHEYIHAIHEQPKHDPCRLFKKGDKVKPAERHGRKTQKLNYKAEYTVTSSENDYGTVGVEYFNGAMTVCVSVPFYWLELVTPVEEIAPYKVWDTTYGYNVGVEDTTAVFYYSAEMSTRPYTKEQAKAAAEAECNRLNEEWRKEHENEN